MSTQLILLNRAELQALTGLQRPSAMKTWLERRNWIFETATRSSDIPKVSRQYFDYRMSGCAIPGQRQGPRVNFFAK